jgi:hypothetical protein
MNQTNQNRPLDAPGTSKELRAYIDEFYGTDFQVVALGLRSMVVSNIKRLGKEEIPVRFRLQPLQLEAARAEAKAREEAEKAAAQ